MTSLASLRDDLARLRKLEHDLTIHPVPPTTEGLRYRRNLALDIAWHEDEIRRCENGHYEDPTPPYRDVA